jgi:hypothetical protein
VLCEPIINRFRDLGENRRIIPFLRIEKHSSFDVQTAQTAACQIR